jgi:hypothetical protein
MAERGSGGTVSHSLWQLHEGNLEERLLLLGTPKDMLRFWKWASASIVALLLGNMEGCFTLGAFREKKLFLRVSRDT